MTKRIISVLLILVLSVSVVIPAFAADTGTLIKLEDKSSSSSYYSTYGKVYDASTNKSVSFSYSVPDGGVTVLLFYSTATSNNGTPALFSELSNLGWAKSGKVNFIAVESSKATASAASAFINKYDKSGFIDKAYYDNDDQHLLMWYYTYIKNNGSMNGSIGYNIAYCYAVFITSENGKKYIRYSLSGVDSASDIASALSKIMDTSSLATGYGGYLNSGTNTVAKLSKYEMAKVLKNAPKTKPDTDAGYFDTAPVIGGSYSTGKVRETYIQAATDRLSALRKIAGLSAVRMDSSLNSQAQYGAVLLASSDFSHTPAKPGDMDASFFDKATAATKASNISAGFHLTETPDSFMDDSDINNVEVLGHRRWQLNPSMAKVGFGIAVSEANPYYGSACKYYADEMAHDMSAAAADYRFISWPSSGNFPVSLFHKDEAWSVTLNSAYYQTPDKSGVKVTLTRTSDSKKWTFSGSESYTAASSGKFFNVENGNYGTKNCIIFRPNGITAYDGEYTVVISGLKDSFGNSVSLSYKVVFFDAEASQYQTAPNGWYEDMGKTYYYSNGVMYKSKLASIGGYIYYFGSDGAMYTKRLISVSGKKYYVGADGKAYTKKLISVSGKKYYMGADGVAYTNKLISVSGKKYYMGSDGVAYTNKLISVSGKKYYMGSDGVAYTSKLISVNGKKYYMGKDGVAYKSKLISVSGKKYYIGSDCVAYKSKFASLSGKKYYFGSDCVMYKSKTFSVSGVKWKADSNGVCKKV